VTAGDRAQPCQSSRARGGRADRRLRHDAYWAEAEPESEEPEPPCVAAPGAGFVAGVGLDVRSLADVSSAAGEPLDEASLEGCAAMRPGGILDISPSTTASAAMPAASASRRWRSASISSRIISMRTLTGGGARDVSSAADGASTVSPVSPDSSPSSPPRGLAVVLPRSTASGSMDVTPGTLPSDEAIRAAPHDEHVLAPAGAMVEHQGQRMDSGGVTAASSDMRDTLAPRRKAAHPSMVRGGGNPTRHSHSIVAGGLLLMS
jgi:hypothetical protein